MSIIARWILIPGYASKYLQLTNMFKVANIKDSRKLYLEPGQHLWYSFLAKIVKGLYMLAIYEKKAPS